MAMALFLSLFALDAFPGRTPIEALGAFAIHLVPAAVLAVVVAAAWRMPIIGAVAFAGLAVGYAAMVAGRLDWILVISGPLGLTAVMYAISAYVRDGRMPTSPSSRISAT
jgi:CHASE2 domain-containing sensor protein